MGCSAEVSDEAAEVVVRAPLAGPAKIFASGTSITLSLLAIFLA